MSRIKQISFAAKNQVIIDKKHYLCIPFEKKKLAL